MVEVVVGGTDPGPLHATAGGAATAAAGHHPQGAAVAEATAAALQDQSAEAYLPGGALPALTAGHPQGLFAQPGLGMHQLRHRTDVLCAYNALSRIALFGRGIYLEVGQGQTSVVMVQAVSACSACGACSAADVSSGCHSTCHQKVLSFGQ